MTKPNKNNRDISVTTTNNQQPTTNKTKKGLMAPSFFCHFFDF